MKEMSSSQYKDLADKAFMRGDMFEFKLMIKKMIEAMKDGEFDHESEDSIDVGD